MIKTTYTVHELAELSGVSVRTLHHYDQEELLCPARAENNYRCYGPVEVDRLQQILLYRRLGLKLHDIKRVLDDASFDVESALRFHLEELKQEQLQTEKLIASIEKTLAHVKGKTTMSNKEKFEGFKKNLIEENEKKYGAEVREKFGNETVDASNAKVMGMSEEQYAQAQELEQAIKDTLREAMETTGDPASELAQKACDLHRQWLCLFWKDDTYNKQAHVGLAEGYVADERFQEYYEQITPGATKFLRDAIVVYAGV